MTEKPIIDKDAPYIRFAQVDVLRGFAVLGIYWINIIIIALPVAIGYIPPELDDDSHLNSAIGLFSDLFVEGTMIAVFSMLFGASALIFLSEAKLASAGLALVDRYYRRTMLLVLFGLVHAYLLLWPYDVLYVYGLFGLLLFPLRGLSARTLLICGIGLLILGDLQPDQLLSGKGKSAEYKNSPVSLVEKEPGLPYLYLPVNQPDNEDLTAELRASVAIDTYRSDYITIFTVQRYIVEEKQTTTVYEQHIFEVGGMMLTGMALWKLGVLSGQLPRYVYLIFVLVGYIAGTILRYAIFYFGLDTGSDSESVFTAYNVGRLPIALGHIGLIGLLCSSRLKFATKLLANVGRMSLTNYIMQTVISIFLFYGFGFALYAQLQRYQLAIVCVLVWLFQIVFSSLWLGWFKHGPLEWLWRSMIYGKIQSLRRKDEAESKAG